MRRDRRFGAIRGGRFFPDSVSCSGGEAISIRRPAENGSYAVRGELMAYWLGAMLAYLVSAFIGSALLVRCVPANRTSRLLRRHLMLFPLAPVLAAAVALIPLMQFAGRCPRLLRRTFESLSGRRQYVRIRYSPYSHYAPRSEHKEPTPLVPLAAAPANDQAVAQTTGRNTAQAAPPTVAVSLIVPSSAPAAARSSSA